MPPSNRATMVRSAVMFERIGRYLSLPFAGVHIVEATKDVFSAIPARRATKLAAQLKPILVPAPVVGPRREKKGAVAPHRRRASFDRLPPGGCSG